MDIYQQASDFTLQYGLFASIFVICGGLLIYGVVFWFWLSCLIHAYKTDHKDRVVWIVILLISFFIPGFVWQFIATIIYYVIYKPKLLFR